MAKRIALFDNIKGVLIILVVAGHFMHPVHNDNLALSAAFDVIYLFHMPLFVFVSGLFAKGAYREGHLNVNRMISFLVLGLAYQAAYLAISGMLTPQRMLLFTSAPWYLIGMAWWYAATPMLSRLPAPVGLAVSLCASLASGCIDLSNGFLAISRSLAFLPFFSLGYYCTTEQLEHLSYRRGLWAAIVAAVCIALLRIADAHAYDWFFQMVYGDNPYRSGIASGVAAWRRGSRQPPLPCCSRLPPLSSCRRPRASSPFWEPARCRSMCSIASSAPGLPFKRPSTTCPFCSTRSSDQPSSSL